MHVLPNGLPCFCVSCVRERNEAAGLDQDLLTAFRLKIASSSGKTARYPLCECFACNRYGRNGMEGCLNHRDENYEKIEARAASLLREMLTDAQWECWENNDYFSVKGSRGNIYRIYRMPTYNVLQVHTMTWCCTLPHSTRWADGSFHPVPPSDGRVAQMLAIMTDEDAFMTVANRTHDCMHGGHWTPPDLVPERPKGVHRYGRQLIEDVAAHDYRGNHRRIRG